MPLSPKTLCFGQRGGYSGCLAPRLFLICGSASHKHTDATHSDEQRVRWFAGFAFTDLRGGQYVFFVPAAAAAVALGSPQAPVHCPEVGGSKQFDPGPIDTHVLYQLFGDDWIGSSTPSSSPKKNIKVFHTCPRRFFYGGDE